MFPGSGLLQQESEGVSNSTEYLRVFPSLTTCSTLQSQLLPSV
jgi:hypothetical protein